MIEILTKMTIMKKIFFTFILIILCSTIKAQWFDYPIIELDTAKLQVSYQLTYFDDTNHMEFMRQEQQILIIGDKASSYQSYNNLKFYQTGRKKQQEGNLMVWLQSGLYEDNYVCAFHYVIYKNHHNGIITYTDYNMSAGNLLYEENKQAFDWEITTETDSINGFLSQKAMCNYGGRRWEAWFTPDIPYSDGPYKFCGLPGLILKIADTQGHYSFNVLALELSEHGTMVEFRDINYIKTTRKEFNKMMDDYNKDIINVLRGMGIDASNAQQASQYVASKNNPLELDRK